MNKNSKQLLAFPYIIWMVGFTVIPLLMVFFYGLTDRRGAFTMSNILAIFTDDHMKALILSLTYSIISTIICLLIAYPLAMILRNRHIGKGSFVVFIFILPMWMNFLLRTLAWQTLLEKNGVINTILSFLHLPALSIINTPAAIVLGMVYNFLPFMVLPLYSVMAKLDPRVIEAAQDLGCNGWNVFRRIVLPLSVPGITAGITMVFVPAVSTFIITKMLGGGITGMLIGDVIESMFIGQAPNYNVGATLSLLLMALMLLCMAFMGLADRDDDAIGGMMT